MGCNINPFKTRILTSCNGQSILTELESIDSALAAQVRTTIAMYSADPPSVKDGPTTPIELTSGFRLLGTPVGSPKFAQEFFNERLADVEKSVSLLHTHVPDLQTRLRIFTQCTIQKLPHLLGADIMHNLPLSYDGTNWEA